MSLIMSRRPLSLIPRAARVLVGALALAGLALAGPALAERGDGHNYRSERSGIEYRVPVGDAPQPRHLRGDTRTAVRAYERGFDRGYDRGFDRGLDRSDRYNHADRRAFDRVARFDRGASGLDAYGRSYGYADRNPVVVQREVRTSMTVINPRPRVVCAPTVYARPAVVCPPRVVFPRRHFGRYDDCGPVRRFGYGHRDSRPSVYLGVGFDLGDVRVHLGTHR